MTTFEPCYRDRKFSWGGSVIFSLMNCHGVCNRAGFQLFQVNKTIGERFMFVLHYLEPVLDRKIQMGRVTIYLLYFAII